MTRREYVGAAAETELAGAITPTSQTIVLSAATGWPTGAVGPFLIVIDPGTASEEKVLVTSRTDTSLTVAALSDRGYDDTTAVAHDGGAVVQHVAGALDFDEANAHINDVTLDHHTQYLNEGRHAAIAHTSDMVADGAITSAKLVTAQRAEPGDIKLTARPTPSTGWLACDGSAVSRTTYANLFDAIGTAFGTGDGSTTFNLPDLRDRVPVGAGSTYALGEEGGATTDSITLGTANLPSHTHSINHDHASVTSGLNSVGHSHSFSDTSTSTTHSHAADGSLQFVVGALSTSTLYLNRGSDIDHGSAGADVEVSFTALTETDGAHTHDVSGTTGTQSADHTHTVDLPSFSGTSGSTGSGTAFSVDVVQPYAALLFVIKT